MQHPANHESRTLIQSVQRAARLLKAFDNGAAELGVSELSRKVALHKSTASRIRRTTASTLLERSDR